MLVNVLSFILAINLGFAVYVAFLLLFHGSDESSRESRRRAYRDAAGKTYQLSYASKPVVLVETDELLKAISADEQISQGRPNRGKPQSFRPEYHSVIPGMNGERHDN